MYESTFTFHPLWDTDPAREMSLILRQEQALLWARGILVLSNSNSWPRLKTPDGILVHFALVYVCWLAGAGL